MSDDRTPTADLAASALKQYHDAFIALVNRCPPLIYARAARYVGAFTDGPIHTDDFRQRTYLRAYKNLGELKDPKAFLPWILTILDRLAARDAAGRTSRTGMGSAGGDAPVTGPGNGTGASLSGGG